PFSCRATVSAKASACQGSAKTGSSMPGGSSRWLKIALPGVDRDGQRRVGVVAPYLAAVKDDGVDPLRILAFAMRVGVGEDVPLAHRLDHAVPAARITRQPCVA